MRRRLAGMAQKSSEFWISAPTEDRQGGGRSTSSPSEKHGWRVFGGMMGPVQ